MDYNEYNALDSGDRSSILEAIFADNTELLFGDEDKGEDYDYAQNIIDASYHDLSDLSDGIQKEIKSGTYDYVIKTTETTESEAKATEDNKWNAQNIDQNFWDHEMNIFDKMGVLRDIGYNTDDKSITGGFDDLPEATQDAIRGFKTNYRVKGGLESKASETFYDQALWLAKAKLEQNGLDIVDALPDIIRNTRTSTGRDFDEAELNRAIEDAIVIYKDMLVTGMSMWGGRNTKATEGSIEWTEVDERGLKVIDTGSTYKTEDGDTIIWSSFDAEQAQRRLNQIVSNQSNESRANEDSDMDHDQDSDFKYHGWEDDPTEIEPTVRCGICGATMLKSEYADKKLAGELAPTIEDMKYDTEPMRFGDGHGVSADPLYPESTKKEEPKLDTEEDIDEFIKKEADEIVGALAVNDELEGIKDTYGSSPNADPTTTPLEDHSGTDDSSDAQYSNESEDDDYADKEIKKKMDQDWDNYVERDTESFTAVEESFGDCGCKDTKKAKMTWESAKEGDKQYWLRDMGEDEGYSYYHFEHLPKRVGESLVDKFKVEESEDRGWSKIPALERANLLRKLGFPPRDAELVANLEYPQLSESLKKDVNDAVIVKKRAEESKREKPDEQLAFENDLYSNMYDGYLKRRGERVDSKKKRQILESNNYGLDISKVKGSKANEIIEDLSDVDSLDLHGSLEDGKNLDSGWHWNCDYCSGIDLGSGFGAEQIHIIEAHLRDEHNIQVVHESKATEDFRPRICPACRGKGCGVCDDTGFVSKQTFEELEHIFETPEGFELTDVMLGYESKAKEHYWDDKTFTCDKCGKVGTDFVEMAKEPCPADVGASHQIPIFGDRKTSESKAKELSSTIEDMKYDYEQMRFGDGHGVLEDPLYPESEKSKESSPDEVWCDLNNQWEDETSHKNHIKKQFGENEDEVDWEDEFKKQAKDRGYGDALDSGQLSITTFPSDFFSSKKKRKKKGSNEDFKEEEHPRKSDGKFTSKGSGSSSSNGDDKEEDIDDGYTEEDNKKYYDRITQNTLETLTRSKVNGFPFFSYIGKPKEIYKDGKGGVILFGMKRNPNSIRKIDIKYDEGSDTYSVSFTSNRNKPKGEYHFIYFDQLSDLIAGKGGLGVESIASERGRWECPVCGSRESIKFPMTYDDNTTRACKQCGTPYDPNKEYTDEEKNIIAGYGNANMRIADTFFGKPSRTGYESIANEVDNSIDLGLLSGDTVVDTGLGLYDEQCPICGKDIDNNFMDYHMEQDHGVHSPSQYTQDTISQSMGDPNYDHLEDWRTSYGESKKIANEVEPDLAGCPFCKSNNIEEVEPYGWTAQWVCNNCGKVFGELDYMPEPPEPTPEELEDDRLADAWLNDTDPNKVPSEKEIFGESKANEGMAENVWNEWSGLNEDGGVIWEDWREFAIDEGLTDKQIQEQYEKHWGVTDKEPVVEPAEWNSLTQGETPYGLGYESKANEKIPLSTKGLKLPRQMDFQTGGYAGMNDWGGEATLCEICGEKFNTYPEFLDHYQAHDEAQGVDFYTESKAIEANPPPDELGYRLQNEDDERSRDPDFEENPMNIGGDGFAQIVIENDGVDWVWNRTYGAWEQSEFTESEGADEPEYYDDIPEEKFPTDFKLEDVKEEDVVVESSEDDYEWEEDYKKFGDYEEDDDYDYAVRSADPNPKSKGSNTGTSKAEEAFNRGASAEEIYSLVDTKESEDDRTQSEDDYLTNLYNKTTANKSAGFIDI